MTDFERDNTECPRCGAFVGIQHVKGEAVKNYRDEPVATVLTALCPRCQDVVIYIIREDKSWERYPYAQPRLPFALPEAVAEAYREAQLATSVGALRAAVCMLRRTVASACSDQGIPDSENGQFVALNRRVEKLKDRLVPVALNAALKVKILGDAGAHEEAEDRLGPINEDTVREALAVVETFLSNLYQIPEQVRRLGESEPGTRLRQ